MGKGGRITLIPIKTRKAVSHHWEKICKTLAIPYCVNCGLVALKNEATRKAIKASCSGEIDEF